MSVRLRFAPSPTGSLHLGGARTALLNYLFVKKEGGRFILRVDDTDKERSTKENEEEIKNSLKWLGLDWDEGVDKGGDLGPYRQSEKTDSYIDAVNKLVAEDKAYIDEEGVTRLRYYRDNVLFTDLVCGDVSFEMNALGTEPALLRSDGSPTYQISTVVDDIDMKITHVVRGQDHLTNSAKHFLLYEALGAKVPSFAHLPLILSPDGEKLSKRSTDIASTVTELKDAGYLPEAVNNALVLLGWSHPESKELLNIDECIENFSFDRVNSSGAKFDKAKLTHISGWWVRNAELDRVSKLSIDYLGDYQELALLKGEQWWTELVDKMREGWATLSDAKEAASLVLDESIELKKEAIEFLGETDSKTEKLNKDQAVLVANSFLDLLNSITVEGDSLQEQEFTKIINTLKKEYKPNAKIVFKTSRILVSGDVSGPELKHLVPLMEVRVLKNRAEEIIKLIENL